MVLPAQIYVPLIASGEQRPHGTPRRPAPRRHARVRPHATGISSADLNPRPGLRLEDDARRDAGVEFT
jgi:hypothetical protein